LCGGKILKNRRTHTHLVLLLLFFFEIGEACLFLGHKSISKSLAILAWLAKKKRNTPENRIQQTLSGSLLYLARHLVGFASKNYRAAIALAIPLLPRVPRPSPPLSRALPLLFPSGGQQRVSSLLHQTPWDPAAARRCGAPAPGRRVRQWGGPVVVHPAAALGALGEAAAAAMDGK